MNRHFSRILIVICAILVCSAVFILKNYSFVYPVHSDELSTNIDNLPGIRCSNIGSIYVSGVIKDNQHKKILLGFYNNQKVAIKVASNTSTSIRQCMDFLKPHYKRLRFMCVKLASLKIMEEILLSQELQHPNIVSNLGFCVLGDKLEGLVNVDSYLRDNIVGVSEYGTEATESKMASLSPRDRLRHAAEMASLLLYLNKSPLGPVRYTNLHMHHFIFVGSKIKLSGINNIVVSEPQCELDEDCDFQLKCERRRGYCVGYNANYNLLNGRNLVLQVLSPITDFPEHVATMRERIDRTLVSNRLDVDELYRQMNVLAREQ